MTSLALVACSNGNVQLPQSNNQMTFEADRISGQVVLDEVDSISDKSHNVLLDRIKNKFPNATFVDTDLVSETKQRIVKVDPSEVDSLIHFLESDPRVQHVEPNYKVKASFTPNDPLFAEKQWHMKKIGMETAWNYTTGQGATVAVIDTGVACVEHDGFTRVSDLSAKCVNGFNFVDGNEYAYDDHGHGTHVAGTIAQATNNELGGSGIAFNVNIMPVKVLSGQGWGSTQDVADGIRWAADNGAQVINMSLGGSSSSKVQEDAIKHARSKGVVVIAAAGNDGGKVSYPGATEGVVGVSATDVNDNLARFSNRGPEVDIGAPGVDVTQQTVCEGGLNGCEQFATWNGTSMATPHVAGVAALLVSLGISDPDQVEKWLKEGSRETELGEKNPSYFGAGILDAATTVRGAVLRQSLVRFLAFLAAMFAITMTGRQVFGENEKLKKGMLNAKFMVPGLMFAVGLFFLPMVFHVGTSNLFFLSRPLAELDMMLGANVHRWLPAASVALPALLTVVLWHLNSARVVAAGLATGVAAYLAETLYFQSNWNPMGVMFKVWMLANLVLCLVLARFNLINEGVKPEQQVK